MSVFNENGTLIYTSNVGNADSIYSYIESACEIDRLYANLESEINAYNMSFEILSESLSLDILNEESFKEKASKAGSAVKNFFIKIGEIIKNAFLAAVDWLSKLPGRAVILPNKKKIIDNFKELKNHSGGMESVAEYKNLKILASKGYNKCCNNFDKAVKSIRTIWSNYEDELDSDTAIENLGSDLIENKFNLSNYKKQIHDYLFGIDENNSTSRTISSLDIGDVIKHALNTGNDIKSLNINIKTMDGFMKAFESSDYTLDPAITKFMRTAASILQIYAISATKSIRDVSSACIKLCLDLSRGLNKNEKTGSVSIKNRSIGNTNDYYDEKRKSNNKKNLLKGAEEQESDDE